MLTIIEGRQWGVPAHLFGSPNVVLQGIKLILDVHRFTRGRYMLVILIWNTQISNLNTG